MARNVFCTRTERKLIRKLRGEGKSLNNIAKLIGRSKNMVFNAIKPIKNKKKSGPKRKTSVQTDRHIVKLVKQDPFKSSNDVKEELNLNVTCRTVRRRLVESGLLGRSARKVPLLSLKNVRDRKTFAKNHADWKGNENAKKWRNILWSDESKVNIFGSDGRKYVRRYVNN